MMISVQNLCGGYASTKNVLHDINLDIQEGEFVALLGPNGSGKSTLLKMLSGVLQPTSGSVHLAGKDVNQYRPKERAALVAMLEQDPPFQPTLTVEEIVQLGRYPHQGGWFAGLSGRKQTEIDMVDKAMQWANVSQYKHHLMHHLSGGEKQRVWLAKAFAQQPRILLLDEPTNHMDMYHTLDMLNVLKRWQKEENITIVAILHHLNIAALYADSVALLQDGRLQDVGDVCILRDESKISEVYDVRVHTTFHPLQPKPQMFLSPEVQGMLPESTTTFTLQDQLSIMQTDTACHIRTSVPFRTYSVALHGSGLQWATDYCNFYVPKTSKLYPRHDAKHAIEEWMKELQIPSHQAIGMWTEKHPCHTVVLHQADGKVQVSVVVSTGENHAEGGSFSSFKKSETLHTGKINIMVFIDGYFNDADFAQAMISIAEAKEKARFDLQMTRSNGPNFNEETSADNMVVACTQRAAMAPSEGCEWLLRKTVGEAVYEAVTRAIQKTTSNIVN
ncbi:ABC transporter ATP-binding protein [Longirhabdus pacifica]|uniref:ABC transporter ATP-binding protein n=1 Tax=Longirhabdus pacifica TaxID=2305227 RepID=UPI001008A9BA|nr:ATP-binding cassette domain-containing protein [Longirhabdus pacifica]